VGRIDEATNYAREGSALMHRRGARGNESRALSLTADIAAGIGAEYAEDYHREALALGEHPDTCPQVAHCHFSLGLKLILEPIFEADFQPGSFGYRPKKTAHRVAQTIVQEKTRASHPCLPD
jgi:hypothetical protein